MAIISIPSSIGGVNIPGALLKGPLGSLFGSKYKKNNLQYPSDLSSATKGHVVQFFINEIDPISYQENNNANVMGQNADTPAGALINKAYTDFTEKNLEIN